MHVFLVAQFSLSKSCDDLKDLFGSDRSPRRGNVGTLSICLCVQVGRQAGKQA